MTEILSTRHCSQRELDLWQKDEMATRMGGQQCMIVLISKVTMVMVMYLARAVLKVIWSKEQESKEREEKELQPVFQA